MSRSRTLVSLLDKYGWVRVTHVVQEFYEDMLQDPTLGPFFDRADINELAQHQGVFLSMVMGGPKRHSHQAISHAHAGLGINHEDFEASIRYLAERLRTNGFDPSDTDEIVAVYRRYEPYITSPRANPR